MSGLEKALFNLKVGLQASPKINDFRMLTINGQFTAKQLNRQAAKASKDEQTEKAKLKKVSWIMNLLFDPFPPFLFPFGAVL
jgi:charged multivesicular body protein 1